MKRQVAQFLNYMVHEKNCSANTTAAYQNDLSQFLEFLENYSTPVKSKISEVVEMWTTRSCRTTCSSQGAGLRILDRSPQGRLGQELPALSSSARATSARTRPTTSIRPRSRRTCRAPSSPTKSYG